MKTRLLTQINFLTFVSIALAWLALAVGPAHAASITFGPPVNISADTDVFTNGVLVSAVAVNGGPVTLNGVTFASGTGSFTIGFPNTFGGFGGSGSRAPYAGLTANYQTLLARGDFGGGTQKVTINGLTIGHRYAVQIWCNDSRPGGNYDSTVTGGGGNSVTVTYNNSGGLDGGLGQYVIGAFTADSTTQTFSVGGSSVINVLNAIQLRDLDSGPAAIFIQPSGGTYLLGETCNFSVWASGAAPLGYQWYTTAPNTAITGATTNTYAINPVTTNSAASYFVVVTNLFGSVTSAVATLAVRNVSGITPVGVTASSSYVIFSNPTNLIAGSDLSVGNGGQLGQTANASTIGAGMWYSDGSAVASTWVTFDLGQKYTAITAADIWQMNQNGNLGRGVQTFEIWTSPDSSPADLTNDLGSFSLAEGTGHNGEPVQSLPLSARGVRLIRFAIASDWSGSADDYVGLSGVLFEGTLFGGMNSAPNFGPPAGSYSGEQLVTIASDPGTTIHYTTDGSDPTTSGTAISGASPVTITVPASITETIKAYATRAGQVDSAVASANYNTTAVSQPVWINASGGSWPVAANWLNNVLGGGRNVTADFSRLTLTANAIVTLDGSQLIGNLIFGDHGNTYGWSLNSGRGGTLTLAGTTPTITVSNQPMTIRSAIAGTDGLVKAGQGNLILTGDNTYTGATTISVGTLQLGDGTVNGTIGSGTYAIPGGTELYLNNVTAAAQTWTNLTGAGTIELDSAQAVNGKANWFQSALPAGFTGTLQLDNGRINGNPGNFGGASTIVINNGAQFLAYDRPFKSTTDTFTNDFLINGIGWGEIGYPAALRAAETTIFTGTITLTGDAGIMAQVNSQPMTFTGPISDGGSNYNLTINGAANSPIVLTGTNTYTGPTTIIASSGLIIDGAGQLGSGAYGGDVTDNTALIYNSSAAQTLSGVISGVGNLTISGAGTLTLNGANSYSGATTVSSGTLVANGPVGSGAVTVLAGGTLVVNGTNTLSDALTLNAGGITVMHIAKAAGTGLRNDQFISYTGVTYGGNLTVTATGDPLALGDTFTLFTSHGSYAGSFNSFNLPALPAGLSWDISQLAVNGSITVGNVTGIPVFNPSGGGYAGAQNVTMTSLTPGATIHYTTDKSDPTTSGTAISAPSPVTVSVPVPAVNLTIMAYAAVTGQTASAVVSAIYNTVGAVTWVTPAGGSWSTGANWSNNVVANGSGSTADFSTLTLPYDATVNLDVPVTVGSLVFGDRGNAYNWILADGGGGPLTLDAGGTNKPVITVVNTNTTIGVVLTGTHGFVKEGAGTLTLSVNNSYTGGATISNGMLNIDLSQQSGQIGLSSFAIGSSGTLELYNTTATIDNLLLQYTTFTGSGTINKTGGGQFSIWNGSSIRNFTGQINIQAGILSENNADWGVGLGQMSVDISAGAYLDDRYNTSIVIDKLTGLGTVGNSFVQSLGISVGNNNGSSTFGGSIVDSIFNGSGSMALTKTGTGTFTLTGTNNYTGTTTVSNGTLVVNGSLGATATTVQAGGMLAGIGSIGGAVINNGTLAPGSGGLGTLTINNMLTNSAGSATTLAINRTAGTGTFGNVQGVTTMTFGGTLTVTNLGGTFQNGDTFTLFSAASYSGNFTATNLPALGSGLGWNWNPANGVLSVKTSVITNPAKLTAVVSGGQLTLSWPDTGWTLQAQTNAATKGLSGTWYPVSGSDTTNSVTIQIDPTQPTVFYRLMN